MDAELPPSALMDSGAPGTLQGARDASQIRTTPAPSRAEDEGVDTEPFRSLTRPRWLGPLSDGLSPFTSGLYHPAEWRQPALT
ncbi:unnamed protein product [Pleuronectes platessa]|uniref:Uncharacterized protein n=1 Tax=Pleuronectes platessa TaxID=8262 RepID=A0A9N7W0Y1_PLEPL|nr:unnamed protein product [Pleuronectes platessa]